MSTVNLPPQETADKGRSHESYIKDEESIYWPFRDVNNFFEINKKAKQYVCRRIKGKVVITSRNNCFDQSYV
jgi:hypothetical protein